MHDYYPIIARAVSRLESNTPKARHELFERIRRILIDQLRIREPPPTDSDLRREHAALEAAIHRVEAESGTSSLSSGASVDHPSVRRSRGTQGFSRIEDNVATKGSTGGQAAAIDDGGDLKSKKTRVSRDRLQADEQSTRRLEVLYQRMQAFLADQRQPDLSVAQSKASANAVQQKELDCPGLDSHDKASIATSGQVADAAIAENTSKSLSARAVSNDQVQFVASSQLSDLFSVHCLDELLRGGAEPLAPESLKRDANAILKWLSVRSADVVKPKHYEQFNRALRAYMTEWDSPAVQQQPSGTTELSPSINDDIRAVFGRMLEREQAAAVFDDALAWFATIWIRLMLALNLLVGLILIVAAPTIGAGLGKFAATYSPFNLWCWVCQVFAFSPAVIAIYVRRGRLRGEEDAHGRDKPALRDPRRRQVFCGRPGTVPGSGSIIHWPWRLRARSVRSS